MEYEEITNTNTSHTGRKMHQSKREYTSVHLKKLFGKALGFLRKSLNRIVDSVPDKPFHPGGGSLWSSEKRLWFPKIFTAWENKGKTRGSFVVMDYNFNKLHAKIQDGRIGSRFFEERNSIKYRESGGFIKVPSKFSLAPRTCGTGLGFCES